MSALVVMARHGQLWPVGGSVVVQMFIHEALQCIFDSLCFDQFVSGLIKLIVCCYAEKYSYFLLKI